MMNRIFVGMILIGIFVAVCCNRLNQVSLAFVDQSKEAVQLLLVMVGVVGMWNGVLRVAEEAGIAAWLTRKLSKIIDWLYPSLPKTGTQTLKSYLAQNMTANLLGLGWAATPSGLKAMKEMKRLQPGEQASDAMCMFLVVNVSSLQLIPINIIAYRSQYGAVEPCGILAPALLATFVSTLVAIWYGRRKQNRGMK